MCVVMFGSQSIKCESKFMFEWVKVETKQEVILQTCFSTSYFVVVFIELLNRNIQSFMQLETTTIVGARGCRGSQTVSSFNYVHVYCSGTITQNIQPFSFCALETHSNIMDVRFLKFPQYILKPRLIVFIFYIHLMFLFCSFYYLQLCKTCSFKIMNIKKVLVF